MRIFAIVYVIGSLAFAAGTTIFQVYPATEIIFLVSDSDGRYRVILPFAILFLAAFVPFLIIMIVYNILVARKQKAREQLLDQTGIVIRRDKTLFGAVFPMDILIDGRKMATVSMGKSRRLSLSMGLHTLQVKAMGKTSVEISFRLEEADPHHYNTGFRNNGLISDIYLEAQP
jgi:hypothetical protein